MRHGIELRPGVYIQGKWNNNHYLIKKKLGSGTVGTVYLCESKGKKYALKISQQSSSMTIEVNVLKALKKVQGHRLGPFLIDVDDWEGMGDRTFSFYVMEYLHGENITRFIRNNGTEWLGVFMLQLLEDLEELHQLGWIFGDLKIENLIVLSSPPRVRFVDVGGTTQIGRSIKEYTEFYDRGYWGLGSRRAEPSYDLFAFVMIFLAVFFPHHFPKTADPAQTIFKKIDNIQELYPYRDCLKRAIIGKYKSSSEMKHSLLQVFHERQNNRQKKKGKSSTALLSSLIETGGILLLAIAYFLSSILLL
jgi:serine/threonine-protein kinase